MKSGKIRKGLNLKKLKLFIIPISIFLILIFSFLVLKIIILKNIKTAEKWDVKEVNFTPKGINLDDLTYTESWISVKIDNLKVKTTFIKNAFAFEGPGEIGSEYDKKRINVEGNIKGNIKNGNLSITGTNIKIENTGSLKFYGTLENWGKRKFEGVIELKGLKIKEILEITKYKIPFDGRIYGQIFIDKEKDIVKEIRFNLEIKELSMEGNDQLNFNIKGKYIPPEKKGIIEEGVLKNEKGEKLTIKGTITEKEFEFYFDTEEFSIDELLKLLPDEIKKKYNLKIETSKVVTNKFALNISKKKLIFQGIYSLSQNFYVSKILSLKI